MSDRNVVVDLRDVTKVYKLYDKPIDRLKEALKISRSKNYKEHFALDRISFQVRRGESVGIVGTNGAGKSTLLKLITGVLTQTSGQIQIDGKISALLELGAGFNMEYTGIQNIYLNGSMMGFTKDEMDRKVDDIMEFAGIGEFINQPVKTYSSGMFARLAFAVAINVEPEILIVDEALSVGDIYFQTKCFKKMNEIKEKGTTVLLVTHDLSSVIKFCDRAMLLNKGKFITEGNPKEIVDLYKKILVNQFDEGDLERYKQSKGKAAPPKTKANHHALWKDGLNVNQEKLTYGNHKVSIVDFGIFDEDGNLTNVLMKKTRFKIKMKVKFHEAVDFPICAFTFKNAKGVEITGTNTMFEKCIFDMVKSDGVYVVEFEQTLSLQGGEYLLSLGCTGYEGDEFVVYDRLYDITTVNVVSEQDTVGFYDMDSKVTLTEWKEG